MRRLTSLAAVAVMAGASFLAGAPAASAATDLSGTWNAASLRQGGPGYSLKATAADSASGSNGTNAYFAVLRFHYQDGRVGPKIKAGMIHQGNKVSLLLNGKGGFADPSNPNIMKGTIGQDGSMYFPTCYKQLKFVTKKKAPSMCLFQELPSTT